jgi:hypothetical protein
MCNFRVANSKQLTSHCIRRTVCVRCFLCILIFLTYSLPAGAQPDSLFWSVSQHTIIAGERGVPFWLHSNRYGIFNTHNRFESIIQPGICLNWNAGSKLKLESGLEGVIKNNLRESFLFQGYVNISWRIFSLMAGKQAYSPVMKSNTLQSGPFLSGLDSRPWPKISLGIFRFQPVPFTKGYLEIKGMIGEGLLNDPRENGTRRPRTHEKTIYLRSAKLPVNLYAGIYHFVLYGGTYPGGITIPVDWCAVFTGSASAKVSKVFDNEVNAAGDHSGFFEAGTTFRIGNSDFDLYAQKPFTDKSGMRIFTQNKDIFSGILVHAKGDKLIKGFTYEFIKTNWQSGAGTSDLRWPDEEINKSMDFPAFLDKNFGISQFTGSYRDFRRLMADLINHGYPFGGRDSYYTNGLYPEGVTYYDRALGTPLFYTGKWLQKTTGNAGISALDFSSNRIIAHHLGAEGCISQNVDYRLLCTFTRHWGTYNGLFSNDFWTPNKDYYFYGGKDQFSFMAEIGIKPEKIPVRVTASFGFDTGQIYKTTGALVSLKYVGFSKIKL